MITELQALILGAVQGLTEFLPVSSSAHLVLVPWLFGWNDPGLAFDVALHLGSLLALMIYYWRQWLSMALSIVRPDPDSRRMLILLIVASVPGAIIGLLLEKQAETIFRSPILIASTLALMGVVLWIADVVGRRKKQMDNIYLGDAILIGLSQALAIIPGVSRSGATITTGRFLGIERQDAANFSFLMATPIIAGAGLHEMPKIMHGGINGIVVAGFVSSAVFSLIAIAALDQFRAHPNLQTVRMVPHRDRDFRRDGVLESQRVKPSHPATASKRHHRHSRAFQIGFAMAVANTIIGATQPVLTRYAAVRLDPILFCAAVTTIAAMCALPVMYYRGELAMLFDRRYRRGSSRCR